METQTNTIKEVLKDTSFENYSYEGFDNAEDLFDDLQEQIRNEEIIYHYKAMQYLMENDQSLQESLGIAEEMGFELGSLNSETLATLLYQQDLSNELWELKDEIESCF